jgi:hypothetical protein
MSRKSGDILIYYFGEDGLASSTNACANRNFIPSARAVIEQPVHCVIGACEEVD